MNIDNFFIGRCKLVEENQRIGKFLEILLLLLLLYVCGP